MTKCHLLPVILLALLLPIEAVGQRVDVVTGFEGGDRIGYVFVTSSVTVNVAENVDAIPYLTLSYLYYSYVDARGRVEVRSPGTTAGVNLRYSVPRLTLTAGPAYEVRQTTRRVGTDQRTFREEGALVHGSLAYRPSQVLTLSLGASHSFANDYTRSRLRVMRRIRGLQDVGLSVGAEAMAQGNPEAQAYGAGGVLTGRLPEHRTTLTLRAGYMHYTAGDVREGRVYFGVGGSAVF